VIDTLHNLQYKRFYNQSTDRNIRTVFLMLLHIKTTNDHSATNISLYHENNTL
jgi:hypothetical protein